jgi:hypothetical protein
VNLLSHNLKNTFGGMCFNGASYMIEHYGASSSTGIEMAQTWHIFGDASVQLRTLKPDSLIVTHNSTIPLGDKSSFTVTVKDNDGTTLIPGALVCCWIYTQMPQAYATAYTNASGVATLNITPQTQGDTMWVTVTKFNYKPYEGYALVGPVSVAEEGKGTQAMSMTVNPNFGHGPMNIAYSAGIRAQVLGLRIYDISGRLVKDLSSLITHPSSSVLWHGDDNNGRPVAGGIYLVRLTSGSETKIEKIILIK